MLVSAGTDGRGAQTEGSLPNLHKELELLVNESGFTPVEAIRSATSIAARSMRRMRFLQGDAGFPDVAGNACAAVLHSAAAPVAAPRPPEATAAPPPTFRTPGG